MLHWRVREILIEKGYPHPLKWLLKRKMSSATAVKIMHDTQQRVTLTHLNNICEAAFCTPNDLFAYQPDSKAPLPDKHPLHKLRARAISQLSDKLKKLTPEQIAQLDKLAGEMGG